MKLTAKTVIAGFKKDVNYRCIKITGSTSIIKIQHFCIRCDGISENMHLRLKIGA